MLGARLSASPAYQSQFGQCQHGLREVPAGLDRVSMGLPDGNTTASCGKSSVSGCRNWIRAHAQETNAYVAHCNHIAQGGLWPAFLFGVDY